MPPILRFVDGIPSPEPTVRFDMNGDVIGDLLDSFDPGVPEMRRSLAENTLSDGATVSASSYGSRTPKIRLLHHGIDTNDFAARLAPLVRELDRPTNVLEYRPGGASRSVYFRTFRSPLAMEPLIGDYPGSYLDIELLAEPFAYGPRVDRPAVTVANDPVAANGMYFDVSGVEGEIETPGFFSIIPSESVFASLMLAARRRGDPTKVSWFRQCEDFVSYTDTTAIAGGTDMSGPTTNAQRTTFATVFSPSDYTAPRLYLDDPLGAASDDVRGTYRLFAVVRCPDATSAPTFRIRATWSGPGGPSSGLGAVRGRHVDLKPLAPQRYWVDLGLFDVPSSRAPETVGYGTQHVPTSSGRLWLKAARLAGTGVLDWDYVAFTPADDSLGFFEETAGNLGVADGFWLDGPNDISYARRGGNLAAYPVQRTSGLPMLSPGQRNRFILARPDRFGVDRNHGDVKTRTSAVTVSYYPRYLLVR